MTCTTQSITWSSKWQLMKWAPQKSILDFKPAKCVLINFRYKETKCTLKRLLCWEMEYPRKLWDADVIRPENTEELRMKFSTHNCQNETMNRYKRTLSKLDPYIWISEISMKILTDDAINATVNPTNTPMAWDLTNIFFFFITGSEPVQKHGDVARLLNDPESAADGKGLI